MGATQSRQARSAAENNDVARLQEIASANPGALLRQSLWKLRSALHTAARSGSTEALCAVLDIAAHRQPASLLTFLNAPDYVGDTALALACKSGYADCTRELLEAGASPLPANSQGCTALHHAAARGHAACIHLLITATVRLPDGTRCPAAQAPVRDVVDRERFVDTRTHAGLCALHLAVLCGSYASVAELVNHGAQLDTPLLTVGFRTPMLNPPCLGPGSTALHMAAARGRLPLIELILHAQQQRHPGLELRRMRNARGMTPLNIALVCDHRNLASLLTAGAPVPAPPAPPRGRPSGQLPPLLRQQLLALVHRAALLSQLRELGLGARGAAAAPQLPGLAGGPIARLEALLHSDVATAGQVLAVVDELLDEAAEAAARSSRSRAGSSGGGRDRADQLGSGAAAAAAAAGGVGARASGRRRERSRRRQEREQAATAAAVAGMQSGVDWTLLERNRSLWAAEHGGSSLYRRLHRRQERQRQAPNAPALSAAAVSATAATSSRQQQEHALLLAGALLQEGGDAAAAAAAAQQHMHLAAPGSSSPGAGSSGSSSSGSSTDASGPEADNQQQQQQQQQHQQKAQQPGSVATSQAEGAICPVCLDLPADVAVVPCGHRACLGCCGRLAAYCASGGSSSSFGLPATGPLCPLCRAPIETFLKAAI